MLNPPAVQNYWQLFSYLSNKLVLLGHTNTYAMQFLLYLYCILGITGDVLCYDIISDTIAVTHLKLFVGFHAIRKIEAISDVNLVNVMHPYKA